jgi:hypothetical protein
MGAHGANLVGTPQWLAADPERSNMRPGTKNVWKEVGRYTALLILFAGCGGFILYQLYLGWAHHVIELPMRGHLLATFDGQPVGFLIGVAWYVALLAILSCFAWFVVYVAVYCRPDRTGPRPPLDNAIRQSLDER